MSQKKRLIIVANKSKASVAGALAELRVWLQSRADIVAEPEFAALANGDLVEPLPPAYY